MDRVEDCFKLLHLPTDQVKVFSTIDDPAVASPENLALSFAVYFVAVISLEHQEVQESVGLDKHTILSQIKLGFEQALAQGDFLDRPTVTGLHALALYLVCFITLDNFIM